MIKFKNVRKEKRMKMKAELKEKLKTFDLKDLNNNYDAIIKEYKHEKVVDSSTRDLEARLSALQDEVLKRLTAVQKEVREYDQIYNKSIVEGTTFDIDYYKKIKEEAFRLDSLSRTINERLTAIQSSVGMKR